MAEIGKIQDMGVEIECNTRIDDVMASKQEGGFDAVFIATGTPQPRRLEVPGDNSVPVLSALDVLRDFELENKVELRGHVVISGGGNTAMDVARSAIRLGALKATVVAMSSRDHLQAHPMEIREALEEGVNLVDLRSVSRMEAGQLVLEKMSETNNSTTRPTGEFENIPADVLVQAIGQHTDSSLFDGLTDINWQDDRLQVNSEMSTGIEGVFAGGDLVPTGGNVTTAIGHGKKAARNINAWLLDHCYVPPVKSEPAKYEYLETWYYSDAPRTHRPILDMVRRTTGFAEVVGNLDAETAAYEARRCMSCGNCFECDNCYGVCPDNAVKKLGAGKGFEFDYDYCKGCGICVSECPCGAIRMEPESI